MDSRAFFEAHVKLLRSSLLLLLCLLPVLSTALTAAAQEKPEIVVTKIFIGDGSEIDDDFLVNGGKDLAASESVRLVSLLKALPQYNVHDSFIENPATSVGSLSKKGNRVYVRGIISRADVSRKKFFGDVELWTFSIGLSLEFFDIQSGQVYYSRSLTSRVPVETATEIDAGYRHDSFAEALSAGLDHLVGQIGKDYLPSSASASVIIAESEDMVFIDGGSTLGFYPGLVVQLRSEQGNWMLKLTDCEEKFSRARIQASSGGGLPPLGASIRVDGLNSSSANGGQRLAVSGVTTVNPASLDPAFDVDNATMGQWLHDALAESAALPLLPPLLADGSGSTNALKAAFFDAQAAFSVFGDVKQSEIIGNRAFPDLLVRAVITHAINYKSQRLGYTGNTLTLGVALEIYDRRTRETLFSVSHEGKQLEKQNESYRQTDLVGAWRDLAKRTLRETAELVVQQFKPGTKPVVVSKLESDGTLRLVEGGELAQGLSLQLARPEREISDAAGNSLGSWKRVYGIVEIVEGTAKGARAKITLSDGSTKPAKGDLLLVPETPGQAAPRARLAELTVGGPKVENGYDPDHDMVLAWLQRELAGSGMFMMLPPASQQKAFDAADVALAGGEFKLADMGELLSPTFPEPEYLIDARLGLARWTKETKTYRSKLEFTTGMELSFRNADGTPALLAAGSDKVRLAWTEKDTQETDGGKVIQGIPDEEFPQRLTQCLETCITELVKQAATQTETAK